jgi:rRNA-processing protein FCF1
MATTPTDVLLDANLLLFLAVGQFDPNLIGRKRLDIYTTSDFELLKALIDGYQGNRTTPHVLAEVSNLADQCVPRSRHREFRSFLADLVKLLDEKWVPAEEICATEEFSQLGLADAAITRLADEQTVVFSVDAELCNVLWGRGVNAENFNHHRDRSDSDGP